MTKPFEAASLARPLCDLHDKLMLHALTGETELEGLVRDALDAGHDFYMKLHRVQAYEKRDI